MKTVKFSRAGIETSALALGTWAIGGSQWGAVDDAASIAAIETAIEKGLTFIDTAPVYGWGHSETVVGKAIKGKRDKVFLATKCGLVPDGKIAAHDLSAKNIAAEIDASLKRLNIDYIDLYQTHWPDVKTPLEETYGALSRLREKGKIKHIGVCNAGAELLKQIDSITPLVSVQNEFSYLRRAAAGGVLEYCQENGLAFLAYGPLAGGVLSGKYSSAPNLVKSDARAFFYRCYKGAEFEVAQAAARKFKEVAAIYNVPAAAAAINWVRAQGEFIVPLVGAKTREQVIQNASALSFDLSQKDLNFLNAD